MRDSSAAQLDDKGRQRRVSESVLREEDDDEGDSYHSEFEYSGNGGRVEGFMKRHRHRRHGEHHQRSDHGHSRHRSVSEHHDFSLVKSFLQQKVLLPTDSEFETMLKEQGKKHCATYCAQSEGEEEHCLPMDDDHKLLEGEAASVHHTKLCREVCEKEECGKVTKDETVVKEEEEEEKGHATHEATAEPTEEDFKQATDSEEHRYCGTHCAQRPSGAEGSGCLPLVEGKVHIKVEGDWDHKLQFMYCDMVCDAEECKKVESDQQKDDHAHKEHPTEQSTVEEAEKPDESTFQHAESKERCLKWCVKAEVGQDGCLPHDGDSTPITEVSDAHLHHSAYCKDKCKSDDCAEAKTKHAVVKDTPVLPTKVDEKKEHHDIVELSQKNEQATGTARGCKIDAANPDQALKQVQDCAKDGLQPRVQKLHDESERSAQDNQEYVNELTKAHELISGIQDAKLMTAFETSQQKARNALSNEAANIAKTLDGWAR